MNQRIELFKVSLQKAIELRRGCIIFEDPKSGSFLQFAFLHDDKIMMLDIPIEEIKTLPKRKQVKLSKIVDFDVHNYKGKKVAQQKIFKLSDLVLASQVVEKIFLETFNLPNNYDVKVETL